MKRSIACVCVLFALVIVCAGIAVAGGDAAKGKAVYTAKCATCHSADGAPKAAIAKALKADMKHLGSKEAQAKSDAEMKKAISEGSGKMKPVKLTDDETANVIAFVRTLKQ